MSKGLASFLVRNITYPLWMLKDGDRRVLNYIGHFDFVSGLGRDELIQRQFSALKHALSYACEKTSYYRKLFDDAGFSPQKMKEQGDIRKLPLLTKDVIRANFNGLKAEGVNPALVTRATTGGSTGTPLEFLRDKESLFLRRGQELFFDRWMGYDVGDKVALFVAASHFTGRAERLKARIRNSTCERMLAFDPHHITDEYMEAFANAFRRFKPSMIKCFPNSLAIFADFVKRKGIELEPVRAISATGESLYPEQRALFEKTFGGKVFEKYGTRESGVIACECREHNGLHLFTEGAYLELVMDNGSPAAKGETGRIVVTDLFNRAMPLVRYEIGDMAVQSDGRVCGCGSALPLVEKILGRDRDIITDSFGNPKPGYLFVEVINKLKLTAQFQVVQTGRYELLVKVASDGAKPDTRGIEASFKEILGPRFTVGFEFPASIPRDPSGKYRYVVSKIRGPAR